MAQDEMTCPHCGTRWVYYTAGDRSVNFGGVSGFIVARIRAHMDNCEHRTIDERREWMRKAMKRKPTAQWTVTYYNPGFLDKAKS